MKEPPEMAVLSFSPLLLSSNPAAPVLKEQAGENATRSLDLSLYIIPPWGIYFSYESRHKKASEPPYQDYRGSDKRPAEDDRP